MIRLVIFIQTLISFFVSKSEAQGSRIKSNENISFCRSQLGSVLSSIFTFDMVFPGNGNANKSSPHEITFVEEILPKLSCLEENNVGQCSCEENDSGLRLLQTLTEWIYNSTTSRMTRVPTHILLLLPLLLGYEWYDKV